MFHDVHICVLWWIFCSFKFTLPSYWLAIAFFSFCLCIYCRIALWTMNKKKDTFCVRLFVSIQPSVAVAAVVITLFLRSHEIWFSFSVFAFHSYKFISIHSNSMETEKSSRKLRGEMRFGADGIFVSYCLGSFASQRCEQINKHSYIWSAQSLNLLWNMEWMRSTSIHNTHNKNNVHCALCIVQTITLTYFCSHSFAQMLCAFMLLWNHRENG